MAALVQPLRRHGLDLHLRVQPVDHVLHRLGHAAAGGEAHARRAGLVVGGQVGDLGEVDVLGLKHAPQLLEGDDKVHVATDAAAAGLQLLGGAGADEHDAAAGTPPLLQPRRQHHGRHGHGDIRREAGELLLGHHRPRRAAGGGHERLLFRHHPQEFLRFLHRAQVGAHGDLLQRGEAQLLHGGLDLSRRHVVAELTPEGRRDHRHHLVALTDSVDQLEQLSLVHDGAEGAVHQAHAAADALVVVDAGVAVFILPDGVHAAGLLTGAGKLDDGLIGAGVLALAALDALALVDAGMAAAVDIDSVLGTGVLAVPRQAALAGVRHLVMGGLTAVAGVFDDVHQRGIVVLLRYGALLDAVAEQAVLRHRTQGQSHGQPDTLAHDGALQKNGRPLVAHLARHDLVGQLLHPPVIAAFISQSRYLGKHALTQIGDIAFEVSHKYVFPPTLVASCNYYNNLGWQYNVRLREFLSLRR